MSEPIVDTTRGPLAPHELTGDDIEVVAVCRGCGEMVATDDGEHWWHVNPRLNPIDVERLARALHGYLHASRDPHSDCGSNDHGASEVVAAYVADEWRSQ